MTEILDTLSLVHWNWDPAIFQIGGFQLRYYGVLFALALAVGYMTLRWRYRDELEDPERATNLTYAIMIAVVVGARLAHCFFYDFDRYMAEPIEILKFWKGGLASHGAGIGIILTCIVYDYVWRKTPCRVTLDRLAMCIPFAMICVRLGNFFNSEIVGAPCDPNNPIAFVFERYDMVPRYPSQLFEVGMGLIAGAVMFGAYFYYKKANKPRPLGLMTSLILVLYFGMRFFVEYFKEYQIEENIGGLREGQILSIPFVCVGLIGLCICLFGPWRKQNVLQYNKKYQIVHSEDESGDEDHLERTAESEETDTSANVEDSSESQKDAAKSADDKPETNHKDADKGSDSADKSEEKQEIKPAYELRNEKSANS